MTETTPRRLPAQFLRPLPWFTRRLVAYLAWFGGIVLVLWVGAVVVANAVGTLDVSMAQFARQGGTWFPFSVAISTAAAYPAVHIAAGMTRRSLIGTSLAVVGIMAVLVGGLLTALFAVERLVHDANGWPQRIIDNGWFIGTAQDLPAILGWHLLSAFAAQVSGLLVGTVYLRFGALRGTITLPLTAGPLAALMVLMSRGVELDWLTTPVRIGVALLVTITMAGAYAGLVRSLQLRPPRT